MSFFFSITGCSEVSEAASSSSPTTSVLPAAAGVAVGLSVSRMSRTSIKSAFVSCRARFCKRRLRFKVFLAALQFSCALLAALLAHPVI